MVTAEVYDLGIIPALNEVSHIPKAVFCSKDFVIGGFTVFTYRAPTFFFYFSGRTVTSILAMHLMLARVISVVEFHCSVLEVIYRCDKRDM